MHSINKCPYVFKKGARKGQPCNGTCLPSQTWCQKHYALNGSSGDNNAGSVPDRIFCLETSASNKSVIFKHWNNMQRLDPTSTEYYKNQMFVDRALSYPWNKTFDIKSLLTDTDIKTFISNLKRSLDEEINGMDQVKDEILNLVCKFITNPQSNRNNLALVGAAGVGKSKFIQVISKTLGLPMKVISLGGIKDSAFFLGHSYVYVESGPGKIIQNVIDARVSNPILYFDELDKVSETESGKDIYAFMSFLTDYTQNTQFSDHYFYGLKFDLSKVFFVFTFNDIHKIDKVLLDRLNVVHVPTPNRQQICEILEAHSIPEIQKNIGIPCNVVMSRDLIRLLVDKFHEAVDINVSSGVREYYRLLEKIFLRLNRDVITGEVDIINDQVRLTREQFEKYLTDIPHPFSESTSSFGINMMYI